MGGEIVSLKTRSELKAYIKTKDVVIVKVSANWCGPCKLMDKNTFQNQEVAKFLNDNFYAVKFNAEGNSVVNYKGKVYKNPGYKETKSSRNSSHNFTRSCFR